MVECSMKLIWLALLVSFSLNAEKVKFVTEELPPFQVVNDKGILVGGYSHDIVAELVTRLEFETEIELLPWVRAYRVALTTPNTFIYSIARSPIREDKFIWVAKLKQVKYHFYGLKSGTSHSTILNESPFNQTVSVVRGTVEADLLRQIGFREGVNLTITNTYDAAFQMVLKGRVDSIYMNDYSVRSIASELHFRKPPLEVTSSLNQVLDFYIAANLDTDPEFIASVKAEFDALTVLGMIKPLN